MYVSHLSPVLVMFQHNIKAYQNIYMDCVALHDKSQNESNSNETRVVAKAQVKITARSTLNALYDRVRWPMHETQKAQLDRLIQDFEDLNKMI